MEMVYIPQIKGKDCEIEYKSKNKFHPAYKKRKYFYYKIAYRLKIFN